MEPATWCNSTIIDSHQTEWATKVHGTQKRTDKIECKQPTDIIKSKSLVFCFADRFCVCATKISIFKLSVRTAFPVLDSKFNEINAKWVSRRICQQQHMKAESFLIHLIRVHIWTILLDVMAGIAFMFWLWHIPNAGDYLIDLAMVIQRYFVNINQPNLLNLFSLSFIQLHLVYCAWSTKPLGCIERKSSWLEAECRLEQFFYRMFSISRWSVGHFFKWVTIQTIRIHFKNEMITFFHRFYYFQL